MKRTSILFLLSAFVLTLLAGVPAGYYSRAAGQKGKGLKTALSSIIVSHTTLSYNALWDCFRTTDCRPDGKVWDMYSGTSNFEFGTDQAGNYRTEGDVYNREHSFPKSWFGEASPMQTDLMHIVPTDGYVNGRRSNYPFGETAGERYQSAGGFSKLGTSSLPGYTGIVFEPADEYKGDFARIYFYMVTCYESSVPSWSGEMLDGTTYPALSPWALEMLLRWAAEDPVSEKEIARNDAVYALQRNRNPYVDYPGLEQYVWGTLTSAVFDPDNYDPEGNGGSGPDDGGDTPGAGGGSDPTPEQPTGDDVWTRVISPDDLADGACYLVVCEDYATALGAQNGKVRGCAPVTIVDDVITAAAGGDGQPTALRLGRSGGHYTLYDPAAEGYLAQTGDKVLTTLADPADDRTHWAISVNAAVTSISCAHAGYTDYTIQYNSSSPRFTVYKSSQRPVTLYRQRPLPTGLEAPAAPPKAAPVVCDLAGRPVRKAAKGLYIVGGRKYIVR
ncbi:MAG: endonuclease [Prevotellaceae bacterium]|nr:endonuclease [Prevotellaceae bacterium]